jgi:hypothetical protein
MEALSHKGIKDEKQSVEILMEQTGESRSQIFRLLINHHGRTQCRQPLLETSLHISKAHPAPVNMA